MRALLREDLRALDEQLGLHTDDGLRVTVAGGEPHITLTLVGEQ